METNFQESENSLEFRLAKIEVDKFGKHDEIMLNHHDAMGCRDCEEQIELGIESFEKVKRAIATIVDAVNAEIVNDGPLVWRSMKGLMRLWLGYYDHVLERITKFEEMRYDVARVEKFKACGEEGMSFIEDMEWQENSVQPDEIFAPNEKP